MALPKVILPAPGPSAKPLVLSWARSSVAWLLLLSSATSGCSDDSSLTQVVVRVSADDATAATVRWLRVRVFDQEGELARDQTEAVGPAGNGLAFPASIPLIPRGSDPTRTWRIEVEAFDNVDEPAASDNGFIMQRAEGRYLAGQITEIPIVLDPTCGGPCPSGQTCFAGECLGSCVDVTGALDRPACGECQRCQGAACVPLADDTDCGCVGDRCVGGACVVSEPVNELATGLFSPCLTRGSTLYCFGANEDMGLGIVGDPNYLVPTEVTTFASFIEDLDLGGVNRLTTGFGCVVLRSGEAKCWGMTGNGRIGPTSAATPADVALPGVTVVGVATGATHTCFRTSTGSLVCIGRNVEGQLGRGTTSRQETDVVAVTHPNTWVEVTAGHAHTCATDSTGRPFCWGLNTSLQLGVLGVTENQATPVEANLGAGGFGSITSGGFHGCATRDDGKALCWGGAAFGNLGRLDVDQRAPPGEVLVDPQVDEVSCGASHCCATSDAGELFCWGRNDAGQVGTGSLSEAVPVPEPLMPGTQWLEFQGGHNHSCALRRDGALFCWGDNSAGQLGLGDLTNRLRPTRVCLPTGT